MDKVTVLMSTYNGEKFIKEQLDSILKQVGVNLNLIVRDDGSSDNTINILKKYASEYANVTYYQGKNLKPANSFMELMYKDYDSDYYALADQDDIWDDDKLLIAINKIKENSDDRPMMYCSNLRIVDSNNNYVRNSHQEPRKPNKYSSLVENIATGCTVVYNKKASDLMRSKQIPKCSMHDTWIYMICSFFGYVIYDFEPHINYRQHENNVVGTYLEKKTLKIYLKRIKRIFNRNLQPRYNNAIEFLKCFGDIVDFKDKAKIQKVAFYKNSIVSKMKLFIDKDIYATSSKTADIRYRILILLAII